MPVASKDVGCFDCSVATASTSFGPGLPGTRYCAIAVGTLGVHKIEGRANVCINV
jgi:hypothetical protein